MPKILLITLEYPPAHGGIATYLSNIYSRVTPENLVVLAPKNSKAQEFDLQQKYKIYRRTLLAWWLWPKWKILNWQLIDILWWKKIKEIHISHVLPIGYIALIYNKIFGIPYIVYTHGLDVLLPQKSIWKKFWLKIILKNSKEVVANSNFTREENKKLGIDQNKIKVVYPCVKESLSPTEEALDNLKAKYSLEGKKIILSVGRLVPRKGFDKVIEAMPRVLQEIPNAVYVIIGSGPEKNSLINILDSKFQTPDSRSHERGNPFSRSQIPIFFLEDVVDETLNAWYALCDIFAMPARQIGPDVEGFGIVFLEAALRGKPSLGGRSGGVPEAIEDGKTGFLVDPLNVDEIADKLIKLLKNEDLRKSMGAEARKRALKKFMC